MAVRLIPRQLGKINAQLMMTGTRRRVQSGSKTLAANIEVTDEFPVTQAAIIRGEWPARLAPAYMLLFRRPHATA